MPISHSTPKFHLHFRIEAQFKTPFTVVVWLSNRNVAWLNHYQIVQHSTNIVAISGHKWPKVAGFVGFEPKQSPNPSILIAIFTHHCSFLISLPWETPSSFSSTSSGILRSAGAWQGSAGTPSTLNNQQGCAGFLVPLLSLLFKTLEAYVASQSF